MSSCCFALCSYYDEHKRMSKDASMSDEAPRVYDYLDYREFVREFFEFKKRKRQGFSYRLLAKLAGFASPSYAKMVIAGQRNIKPETARRLAHACQLDAEGTRYFETLVCFNQATSSKTRDTFYRQLSGFRHYRNSQKLELAHAAYYSNWYIPVVNELVHRPDFREDATWVARNVLPAITRKQAKEALEVLFSLGLLRRSEEGRVVQAHAVISTGAEVRGMHIANYHRAMLQRAAESIDLVPSEGRDISSLTLCLGPE